MLCSDASRDATTNGFAAYVTLGAMKSDALWTMLLLGRVLANALLGGLLCAIFGAFGCAIVGQLAEIIFSFELSKNADGIHALSFGFIGFVAGLTFGTLIFATHAFRAPPGHLFEPFCGIVAGVLCGQFVGALAFSSSFYLIEFARALLTKRFIASLLLEDLIFAYVGAPALMICGAIAGALSKRDT